MDCAGRAQPSNQQDEKDGGIKKPRERTYEGLNLPRSLVVQEVKSYLDVNRYLDTEIKEEEARTIVTGGDLAVIISGSPDRTTVAAGPRTVLDVSTMGLAILTVPLFAIAKGIGVAWDKHKIDRFFEYLDRTLYARAGLTSLSDATARGIGDKIRELGKLRDEGLLSDEEFQTKKAALLAKM
jgi:hypothetical protein